MRPFKCLLASFTFLFIVSGCGGSNSSEVNSGSGSASASAGTTPQKACGGEDLKGSWRITVMAGPLTETEVAVFDGSESPGSNVIDATQDGITLKGTIDPSCNSASGTATDGTLSGTFTAVKIS